MRKINKVFAACIALMLLALALFTGIYTKSEIKNGRETTRITTSLTPKKGKIAPFVYGEYDSNKPRSGNKK